MNEFYCKLTLLISRISIAECVIKNFIPVLSRIFHTSSLFQLSCSYNWPYSMRRLAICSLLLFEILIILVRNTRRDILFKM
jgi:hypothetical protein